MASEETELTFIRCPGCRSLVPAIATRCRMCGFQFDKHNEPVRTDSVEALKQRARVRQRTVSVGREEVSSAASSRPAPGGEVEDSPFRLGQREAQASQRPSEAKLLPETEDMELKDQMGAAQTKGGGLSQEVDWGREGRVEQESKATPPFAEGGAKSEHLHAHQPDASHGALKSLIGGKESLARESSYVQHVAPESDSFPLSTDAENANTDEDEFDSEDDHSIEEEAGPPVASAGEHRTGKKRKRRKKKRRDAAFLVPVAEHKEAMGLDRMREDRAMEGTVGSEGSTARERTNGPSIVARTERASVKSVGEGAICGWFVSFGGDERGVSLEIRSGQFFVSREKLRDHDYVVSDKGVSMPHCLVHASSEKGLKIQDLMSEQGTSIKRAGGGSFEPVREVVTVKHGDRIRFGSFEVLVCLLPSEGRHEG